MCIDEFVKILYDFMCIYRIFWNRNSHYRYFYRNSSKYARKINMRHFFSRKITDFFSLNAPMRCVLHSYDFSVEKKIGIFFIFLLFFNFRLFFVKFFSISIQNLFFGDISIEKIIFFFVL